MMIDDVEDYTPDDDDGTTTYGLVMPFIAAESYGGPYDDASYAAGWEMGSFTATLEHSRPTFLKLTIHAFNVPQADLVAMQYGYDTVSVNVMGEYALVGVRKSVIG
jgi:hypothetical protein